MSGLPALRAVISAAGSADCSNQIYDQPYENEVRDYQLEGFTFQQRIPVEGEIFLDNNPDIQSLFQMTPYYYKTSAEGQQRAAALKELTTRIQFEILLYTRNG